MTSIYKHFFGANVLLFVSLKNIKSILTKLTKEIILVIYILGCDMIFEAFITYATNKLFTQSK